MEPDLAALCASALPLEALADRIGDARVVLIGEATHGTHEFYALRAEVTMRLIERGFRGIAIEGDLPDAAGAHRYAIGASAAPDADVALDGFRRFPSWMWRNQVMRDFVERLRAHNRTRPPHERAGIFGLDLYSLHQSMEAAAAYLRRIDPAVEASVRERYACFDRYGREPERYAYATQFAEDAGCREAVREALAEISRRIVGERPRGAVGAADEAFFAEENARIVRDAEAYYRTMFAWDANSWNLRDAHMDEALARVRVHLRATRGDDRVVVWAHNSHLGDARATQMGRDGEHNVGQLARARFDGETLLIGLFTYDGTVTAADDWGEAHRTMTVRPALHDAWESLLHDVGPAFALDVREPRTRGALGESPRLERAIGVVYRPQTERRSHYFHADLAAQFDLVVHCDRTRALQALDDVEPHDPDGDLAETFPTGV